MAPPAAWRAVLEAKQLPEAHPSVSSGPVSRGQDEGCAQGPGAQPGAASDFAEVIASVSPSSSGIFLASWDGGSSTLSMEGADLWEPGLPQNRRAGRESVKREVFISSSHAT